jgi:hypothetical protein
MHISFFEHCPFFLVVFAYLDFSAIISGAGPKIEIRSIEAIFFSMKLLTSSRRARLFEIDFFTLPRRPHQIPLHFLTFFRGTVKPRRKKRVN